MIRSHLVGMDLGTDYTISYSFASHPVVNPPTYVASASVCPVCPPTIVAVALGEFAKCIDVTCCFKCVKTCAFFVGEPMFANVSLGVSQVVFGMRNVQITAEQYWFGLF